MYSKLTRQPARSSPLRYPGFYPLGIAWDGTDLWISEFAFGGQVARYTTAGVAITGQSFNVASTIQAGAWLTTPETAARYISALQVKYIITALRAPNWGLSISRPIKTTLVSLTVWSSKEAPFPCRPHLGTFRFRPPGSGGMAEGDKGLINHSL